MTQRDDLLVWCDVETTGLYPGQHQILEVALVLTDSDLQLWHSIRQCVKPLGHFLEEMDPVVKEMHTKSGLLSQLEHDAGIDSIWGVDNLLAKWLDDLIVPSSAPLCGSTISFDRSFLRHYMPLTHARLHYRNIDVSTVKELSRRWKHPAALPKLAPELSAHRALPDCLASIEELRHYRKHWLTTPSVGRPAT